MKPDSFTRSAAIMIAGVTLVAVWQATAGFYTDFESFNAMMEQDRTFYVETLTPGTTHSGNGFSYFVSQDGRSIIDFEGSPLNISGAGGTFSQSTTVTYRLFTSSGAITEGTQSINAGFWGLTTDQPFELWIDSLSFDGGALSEFTVGVDCIAIPEITTYWAAALLAIPVVTSFVRARRHYRQE